MKAFISLLIAPLALAFAAPATAQNGLRQFANIQVADAAPVDHATYTQQAQQKTQEWRVKLDDFNQQAKAKGTAAAKAASDDLDMTWADVKQTAAKLQTAGAAEWASAKTAFESATQALSDRWAKARANLK